MSNKITTDFFSRDFFIFLWVFNLFLSLTLLSDFLTDKLSWDRIVSDYNLAQYYASYSHEFLKRGLIATVFAVFGVSVTQSNVFIFSFVIANLLFIAVWILAMVSFLNVEVTKKYFVIFMLVFICSPATALQFGNDFGRFDTINLLIMVMSLIILLKGSYLFVYVVLPLLTAAALLNHEIYVFTGLPIILLLFMIQIQKGLLSFKGFVVLMAVITVVMLSIVIFGNADSELTLNYLSSKTGFTKEVTPITVWVNSFNDNFIYTLERYSRSGILQGFARDISIVLFYVLLYVLPFKNIRLNSYQKLLLLSPFAILPLFLLGVDFSRWIGLIIFNMFTVFLILGQEINLRDYLPPPLKYLFMAFIGMALVFIGPLGIT